MGHAEWKMLVSLEAEKCHPPSSSAERRIESDRPNPEMEEEEGGRIAPLKYEKRKGKQNYVQEHRASEEKDDSRTQD